MGKIFTALEKAAQDKVFETRPRVVGVTEDVFGDVGQRPFEKNLVTYSQPDSIATEQFRKLRNQLLSLSITKSVRSIMVTSAVEGEGKTLVAANLGAVIAHDLSAHALLVDADLRSPALTAWFGLQKGKGLSNFLTGNSSVSEYLVKTGVEKLSIFPGGTIMENPVELVGSPRMITLVEELKSRYQDRYIIFDTSPILATTEPSALARVVDGVILVIRAGATPRETIQKALSEIDPAKIVGVVLNDMDLVSAALYDRYYGSRGYYYRYRDAGQRKKPATLYEKATAYVEDTVEKIKDRLDRRK